jgi:hypothetical protein
MLMPRALLFSLAALCAFTACGDKDGPEPTDSEEEEEDSATEDSTISDSEDSEIPDNDGDGALADVDCDDADATVYPGAPETCDGRDEDCDGSVDEGVSTVSYRDADGDGVGDPNVAHEGCLVPEGFVQNGADCDDSSAEISPDAEERCDEIDNDCDGRVDDDVLASGVHRTLIDTDIEMVGTRTVNSYLGTGLLSLGDLDGDGVGEVVAYDEGKDDEGWVHLYRSGGALWSASGELSASIADLSIEGEAADDNLGEVMRRLADLDGDGRPELALAAPGYNGGYRGTGAVYVFFSGGALANVGALSAGSADLVLYGEQPTGTFGSGLTSGDYDGDGLSDLAISDLKANNEAGVTYVLLSSGVLATGAPSSAVSVATADISFIGEHKNDQTGTGLVTPGDIDGDGLDDLALSSPLSSAGELGAGMVYVLRSGGALSATTGAVKLGLGVADMRAWGTELNPDGLFDVGDLDGDGLGDLAIATHQKDRTYPGYPGVGQVAVLTSSGALSVGSGDLDLSFADLTIIGEPNNDAFGDGTVRGGDLDGDGRGDLLIAAAEDDRVEERSGAIFVMTSRGSLRHLSGVVSAEDAELVITSASQYVGEGLNALILDDQDADGRAELLIGFPRWNTSGYPEGAMYVVWGETVSDWLTMDCDAGALLSLEHAALTTVDEEDNLAGTSVAILNDLDGDGLSELVIGAPEADSSSGTTKVGEVRVLLSGGALSGGGAEVAYTDADITIQGAARYDYFGERLLATGDIEGDGLPDLVVLAPGVKYGGFGDGVVYVFTSSGALASGASSLTADDADIVITGIEDGIATIADAGDVDGDGRTDLLFGAPETWTYGENGGRAYLLLSSGALAGAPSSLTLDDADFFFKGEVEGSNAGVAIAGAGDVDGDGLGDILIAATPDYLATVYLLLSSGALRSTKRAIELSDADLRLELSEFAYLSGHFRLSRLTRVGDLDGDGLDDIVLSDPTGWERGQDTGAAFVFLTSGSLSALSGTLTEEDAELTVVGLQAGGLTGDSVVSVDDLDGDGARELIITAPLASERAERSGAVYVLRSGGALSTSGDTIHLTDADLTLYGAMLDNAGSSVSAAGDVDGDGLSDLLIGAPADSGFNDRYGAAMLITSGQLIEHALP